MCKIEMEVAYLSTLLSKTTLSQHNQPKIKHNPPNGVKGPKKRIMGCVEFENNVKKYKEPLNKTAPVKKK